VKRLKQQEISNNHGPLLDFIGVMTATRRRGDGGGRSVHYFNSGG
jgi:hypothetical protein